MARIIQLIDLHSCTAETAFKQLVLWDEYVRHIRLLGNDNNMHYIHPAVCFSDGKIPFPIDEQSPGLDKLTSILSLLKAPAL